MSVLPTQVAICPDVVDTEAEQVMHQWQCEQATSAKIHRHTYLSHYFQ